MSRPFTALLAAVLSVSPAPAQEEDVGKPFWVSTPPGATASLQEVTAAISRTDWNGAARSLQTVFDRFPDSFAKSGRGGAYLGARHRALQLMAAAPGAVREEYERLYGAAARQALYEALRGGERDALLAVIRRYEGTAAGLDAILALADHALLRGRPAEARLLLARLPLLHPDRSGDPAVQRRRALAAARDHVEGGPKPAPGEAEGAPALPPVTADAWPMMGGDATRSRVAASVSFHEVQHRNDVMIQGRRWDQPPRPNASFPFQRQRNSYYDWEEKWREYDPVHPVLARGSVVYHDGRQVVARNLYTGELQWQYPEHVDLDADGRTNLSDVFTPVVADGVVYASVEVSVAYLPQTLQGVPITYYIPERRLVALDLETGDVLWRHDDAFFAANPGSEVLKRLSVTGAPVVRGDHLYAGATYSEGTFHNFLVSVDRHTGRAVYATRISNGQQELNLFGRQLQECSPTPVTEADGVLYFGTNLGVFAAVDALLGTPLWATTYGFVPIPSTYYWFEAPRRWPWLANNPPLVVGDVVLAAPADGDRIVAFDRRSGRIEWQSPHRIPIDDGRTLAVRTVLGADRERLYVSGASGVVALWLIEDAARGAEPGRRAWHTEFMAEHLGAGRGLLDETSLWVPTYGAVYRIERQGGKLLDLLTRDGRDAYEPAHLVWGDGVLVEGGREHLAARFDRGEVVDLARARVRENPDEVAPLLGAGDVYLANRDLNLAADHYRRAKVWAEARGVPAAARRAQRGLHRALLRRAERALENAPSTAQAEFEEAVRAAPDDAARLRARLQLHEWLTAGRGGGGTTEWVLRNLREVEAEHGDARLGDGTRTVRGWALRETAEIHAGTGDPRRAVAMLQQLLEMDPAGEDARYATRRIRQLLIRNGRALYEPWERRANDLFDAARRSGDLDALERGLRIYANAEAAVPATLSLAQRQIARSDPGGAVRVLQQFLVEHAGSPRVPEALALMVEALDARRSFGPAYATILKLKTRHPDALLPRSDGARVPAREWAAEWLAKEAYVALARSTRRRDLEPDLELRFEKTFPTTSFLDVPDLLGQRPPALPDVIVLRAHTRIHLLDAADGREIHHLDFGEYEPRGPLVFAGDRIHCATEPWTYVFDAGTGRAINRVRVPGSGRGERLLEHQGQVFLVYRERGRDGGMGIAALDPEDGTHLWTRTLEAGGGERGANRSHVLPRGDRLLVFHSHPVVMTLLDTTSGAVEGRVEIDRKTGAALAPEPFLLPDGRVLVGTVTAEAEAQRFEYVHSYAVHLVDPVGPAQGAVLWTYRSRDDKQNRYLNHLHAVGDYAVALDEERGAAVLDLRTGGELEWVGRLPLPPRTEGFPYLDSSQPRHDSLLLVVTRSVGETPALLSAYELPDLRRKYSVELTDTGQEVASLIEATGVVGITVGPRRGRFVQPKIRLFDPLQAGEPLQEILPPIGEGTFLNAKVQNGILLVTVSEGSVFAYGPRQTDRKR